MHKIAVMQPYFLPYFGYYQLINMVDKFVVYDDVNYINRGWINRNYIMINNEKNLFTLPLIKVSQNKKIYEIEILNNQFWRNKLFKKFEISYAKKMYKYETLELLNKIIYYDNLNLSEYIYNSINTIAAALKIETKIIKSSRKYLNQNLNAENRIIDICKKENCSVYTNLPGGKELYNENIFNEQNIEIKFLTPTILNYNHENSIISTPLSIVDVLMNNGIDKTIELLNYHK